MIDVEGGNRVWEVEREELGYQVAWKRLNEKERERLGCLEGGY